MNTLYFYKSFLRKVRSHLGEPARLTGPAHLYMNSLLIQTILELYSCKVEIFVKCLFINIQKQQNTLKRSLTNLTGKAREFVGLRMLNFQGRIFIKTRTLDYQIGISVPLILWFCYPIWASIYLLHYHTNSSIMASRGLEKVSLRTVITKFSKIPQTHVIMTTTIMLC